ncbi:hypothetical protein AYI68_g5732 [Smittium mucronatum]|uniref:Uncharacterized protein n=1 Tax=Smittium mucronatum TaxID=133383 RepID=A0A1R0GTG9_9FUNG|nr:hypothetical protein AYI68_g5732 [Smittium mucronatum]
MCDIYSILSDIGSRNLVLPSDKDEFDDKNDKAPPDSLSAHPDDIIWEKTFLKYFVHDLEAEHDDMLFFVKKKDSSGKNPIIVSRKPSSPDKFQMPDIEISWKESLFLNLIVQMPCTLTITVNRTIDQDNKLNSSLKKTVEKKVYALPNFPQEINNKGISDPPQSSYPLIYFIVQDFQDCLEDVLISPGEFFSVELSTFIKCPKFPSNDPLKDFGVSSKKSFGTDQFALDGQSHFFSPNPSNNNQELSDEKTLQEPTKKIVLYSSISSYDELLDMYMCKKKNASILVRMRNSSHNIEYVKLPSVDKSGSIQLGIKGANFELDVDIDQENDILFHKSLKHSCSNPSMKFDSTKRPAPLKIFDQKYKSSPYLFSSFSFEKYQKVDASNPKFNSAPIADRLLCPNDNENENLSGLSPKMPVVKSYCSLLINNQYRRFSSGTGMEDHYVGIPKLLPSSQNSRKVAPKLGGMLDSLPSPPLNSTCTALESLNSHKKNPHPKNKEKTFAKWFQNISIPNVVSGGLGMAFQHKPEPDSLNCFVNFVYIPWEVIIDDLISSKNSVD